MRRCSIVLLLFLMISGLGLAQAAGPVFADTDADFSASVPQETLRHVLVGRSVFLKTAHRLARVYVTDPAVLYAYTASPNELLVTAKTVGVSSLVVWDESRPSRAPTSSHQTSTRSRCSGRFSRRCRAKACS